MKDFENEVLIFSVPSEIEGVNNFEIYYNKKEMYYYYQIETILKFDSNEKEFHWAVDILLKFMEWMDSKNYNTNLGMRVPYHNLNGENRFNSIEDLYRFFKVMVNHLAVCE